MYVRRALHPTHQPSLAPHVGHTHARACTLPANPRLKITYRAAPTLAVAGMGCSLAAVEWPGT